MDVLGKALKGLAWLLAALAILIVAAIYALYGYGLKDLPQPLPQASREYPQLLRELYWRAEGGHGAIEIPRLSPPGFVWDLATEFSGDLIRPTPPAQRLLNRAASGILAASAASASTTSAPTAPRSNLHRHLVQAALAIRLSRERSGEQLIDYLLERGYYGRPESTAGLHGIEAASRHYFDLPVEALTPAEALALIAMQHHPTSLDPACHPERFATRYRYVLERAGLAPATAPPARMQVGACARRDPAGPQASMHPVPRSSHASAPRP